MISKPAKTYRFTAPLRRIDNDNLAIQDLINSLNLGGLQEAAKAVEFAWYCCSTKEQIAALAAQLYSNNIIEVSL